MEEAIHIGKAAKLAGVSADTIRFYQKAGLIKAENRSAGGYRLFRDDQIQDLLFVRHAQELGFSLTEIKELLALRQQNQACSEVQAMLKRKLATVRGKMESLARLESELAIALSDCNHELRKQKNVKHEDRCPLLTKLNRVNGSNGYRHVHGKRTTKPQGALEEHRPC